jgi:hypothetical protein
MIDKLNGYKTYIGGALIAIGAFLKTIGQQEYGEAFVMFGEAVAVVGLGHKLAKK